MPNKTRSIPDLCHKIWELETRLDLLNLDVAGVKIWQHRRMWVYYQLAEKCGFYHPPHDTKSSKHSNIDKLISLTKSLTLNNPFISSRTCDIAVFDHPRYVDVNGTITDIYSHYLLEELDQNKENFCVFEKPYQEVHAKNHNFPKFHLDINEKLAKYLFLITPLSISKKTLENLDNLEEEVFKIFSVKLNLKEHFIKESKRFKIQTKLYEILLNRYKVKKVYLVVSYGYGHLISACRKLDIPVYELQHGVINTYHLGYSFPNSENKDCLEYFPNYLLSWGNNWPSTEHLPISPKNVIEYGFKHFENKQADYRHIIKQPNLVTIISQGVLANSLAKEIREHMNLLKHCEIIYKIHPGEASRYQGYEDLIYLEKNHPNFTIETQGDLYKLLAQSSSVIGVFSTALYEAMAFDCRVYICKLDGWEYMEELLETKKIDLFTDFNKSH